MEKVTFFDMRVKRGESMPCPSAEFVRACRREQREQHGVGSAAAVMCVVQCNVRRVHIGVTNK